MKKNKKFIIMDFWAKWCNPCLYMKSIINEIEKKYEKKIYFKKINIDKKKKLCIKYNVQSIPTLIFFKKKKEKYRHIGIISKENLNKKCKKLIS
ncbi:MAG: thioredoxin family protein [Candidatus Shikimatogenerans bostrichidophilus]|nr:MAG: thioredoxin family protein [Candidatus Shikimatogenerans bostrichidophilus]